MSKKIDNIISEQISNFLKRNVMLKEYKNPADAETVKACGDALENMYNNILQNGMSRHEITVETIAKIIKELRNLETMMK